LPSKPCTPIYTAQRAQCNTSTTLYASYLPTWYHELGFRPRLPLPLPSCLSSSSGRGTHLQWSPGSRRAGSTVPVAPLPRASGPAPSLSSCAATTAASGAVAQQRRKHVAALCCRATGGHEVEPRRRAVFIRPPLTTRSTTGRVSAGIPRHTRPPRPRAAPPSSAAGCSAVGVSALPSPALCSAPSPNRGAAQIAPAGSFSLRPSDWVSAGSSLRPFFSVHVAHNGRDKGGEGNIMCTRDCTRGPLLLFFFS